jgi:outer membrane autotransporter protein
MNGATTTAQTTKSAFSLMGGHVDAGAYEYRLYAADANGAGENWYLRSAAAPAGGPSLPTYRAEVPLLAGLPAQLRQGSLAMLGNLHQRIGDEDPQAAGIAAADGSAVQRRAWGRLIGADLDIRQSGTVSPHSQGRLKGLQAGTDLWADANWRAGLYVGHLQGDIDVSGFARGTFGRIGHNDLRSDYLGGYATWRNDTGLYADAVLQAGRHRYTAEPQGNLPVSGKGSSLLASLEVGQSFDLDERWKIEPQLQLVHQRQRLDDVAIGGARVSQQSDDGWLVRAGVRIKGEMATEAGTLQPYARVNYYRTSKGNDVARFIGPAASTDIASATGHSTAEVAAGATLTLNPTASLYGEVGKLFALGGDARLKSGIQGSAGLRVRW